MAVESPRSGYDRVRKFRGYLRANVYTAVLMWDNTSYAV